MEWVAGVVFAMGAAGAAGSPLVRMSEGTRVQMSMRWTSWLAPRGADAAAAEDEKVPAAHKHSVSSG